MHFAFWIIFTTFAENYHRRDETNAIYYHFFFASDGWHNHDVKCTEQAFPRGT